MRPQTRFSQVCEQKLSSEVPRMLTNLRLVDMQLVNGDLGSLSTMTLLETLRLEAMELVTGDILRMRGLIGPKIRQTISVCVWVFLVF